ncbi:MAG TPA: hypothetical protein ENJ31_01075 [Anaerolineae bacterium]|nr:hypothetical protein [Anaerolineae bacterium]
MKRLIAVMSAAALLAACSSTKEKAGVEAPPGMDLPDWVMNPVIEDGLAATDCVKWSGNMSIDRKQAIANARAGLAQQIDIKVKAMDKTYARKVDAQGGTNIGGVFESVSKQVTQQQLSGSRPTKVKPVTINGESHICAMVTFAPAATEELFKNIVKSSGVKLSPQDEDVLYEEFKAFKAQEELDRETSGM